MAKRTFDPLQLIPSSGAVRKKLDEVLDQARRLGVLLITAEQIESGADPADILTTLGGGTPGHFTEVLEGEDTDDPTT